MLLGFISQTYGQAMPGEQNKMLNSMRKDLGKYNILAGVGTSFMVFDGGKRQSMNLAPLDVRTIYVGTSYISPSLATFGKSSFETNMDFYFGVQRISAPSSHQTEPDVVNIFNFSKYSGYYFNAPFKISYFNYFSKNAYWSFGAGGYLGAPILYGTLENNGNRKDVSGMFVDYGWLLSAEFGFRAGFLSVYYSEGITNISDEEGTKIENLGSIAVTLGYRFGTDLGKSDASFISRILGGIL